MLAFVLLGAAAGILAAAAWIDVRDRARARRQRLARQLVHHRLLAQAQKRNAQHRTFKFPADWVGDDRVVPMNKLKQPT